MDCLSLKPSGKYYRRKSNGYRTERKTSVNKQSAVSPTTASRHFQSLGPDEPQKLLASRGFQMILQIY